MKIQDQLFEISQYGGKGEPHHCQPWMVDTGHNGRFTRWNDDRIHKYTYGVRSI